MTNPADPPLDRPRNGDGGQRHVRAAALGLLALAAIIALVLLFGKDDDPGSATPSSPDSPSAPSVPAEASAATASGSASGAASATAGPPAGATDSTAGQSEPAPAGVTVLITSQSWNAQTQSIEVVGSVQGVATETSTCTATATLGAQVATATVDGVFDGQGTSCGLISIPMTGQPSGAYEVLIRFEANAGTATSAPVVVAVP